MINIKDKKDCCGCSACASICPKHCITMTADNEGFLYPSVDSNTCIECGLCKKVCPIIQVKPEIKNPNQRAFLVQHKNNKILKESTSGGAFTAIAKWVLDKGGVVFGASFNKDFKVSHSFVKKYEDLDKFRNSKYVQSEINTAYIQTKAFLQNDKYVLFSGTPCQLEGLFTFLRKSYIKLITIDVVCRACPSPLVLRKYIEMQQRSLKINLKDIKFRNKYHGYKYSTLSLFDKNQNDYHQGIDTDFYLRSFFSGINIRPSCTKCVFRKRYRNTDFTIWDCFDVDKFSKELDNDKGVTRILTHSPLANTIIKDLHTDLKIVEIEADKAVEGVKEMYHSVSFNPKRNNFFHDLEMMDVEECFHKYFPITLRHRLEKQARLWSNRLGIYKWMKKLFKAINGNKEIKR